MKLSDRLRELRLLNNLKANFVAEKAGVSPSLITELEKGRGKPSLDTLLALCEVYDISLLDMLYGVDFAGEPSEKSLPHGLQEFLDDPEFAEEIDEDWQVFLRKFDIKGKRPNNKRDWMKLYLALRQVLDDVK